MSKMIKKLRYGGQIAHDNVVPRVGSHARQNAISNLPRFRKGQLKIQEMAFVLVGIVVLVALVLLFFVAFQSREANKNAAYYREARAITMLEMIASLPELRCSSSFSTTSESVCLDYDKVIAFNSSEEVQNNYDTLWDNSWVSKIEIEEVYVNSSVRKGKTYTIYSKESEGNVKSYATYAALCTDEPSGLICKIAKIRATINMP
jgi:hypothetical protein